MRVRCDSVHCGLFAKHCFMTAFVFEREEHRENLSEWLWEPTQSHNKHTIQRGAQVNRAWQHTMQREWPHELARI